MTDALHSELRALIAARSKDRGPSEITAQRGALGETPDQPTTETRPDYEHQKEADDDVLVGGGGGGGNGRKWEETGENGRKRGEMRGSRMIRMTYNDERYSWNWIGYDRPLVN